MVVKHLKKEYTQKNINQVKDVKDVKEINPKKAKKIENKINYNILFMIINIII